MDGGKRADDKDLKEKRLKKKKAAEKRLKVIWSKYLTENKKLDQIVLDVTGNFMLSLLLSRYLGRPLVMSTMRMGCSSRWDKYDEYL